MRDVDARRIMLNPPEGWRDQFAYLGQSARVSCLTCGATGYDGVERPMLWQARHLGGHPCACQTCGARFVSNSGVAKHRRDGCPNLGRSQNERLKKYTGGDA
jgi:hypothetical protein